MRGWWALGIVLAWASLASAQDTGGSFGGGDWGGGGSDYGGGGSDYGGGGSDYGGGSDWGSSSSDDYDWGSDEYGSGSGGSRGSPEDTFWGCCMFFGVLIPLFAVAWGVVKVGDLVFKGPQKTTGRVFSAYPRGPSPGRVWNGVDVSVLRLGVDWRARAFLQQRLEALAKSGRTKTKAGLAELLRETATLLSEVRLAWLYADVVNHRPMSQGQAQGIFQSLAIDARSRFKKELVRAVDGRVTEADAGRQVARSSEGPGVVVITLIVAARRELLDVGRETDASAVASLVSDLGAVREAELVALEVVWSPAHEDDRMSTAELEAKYPEMSRFDERTVGGRVFCGHCQGPFADELGVCPHCGAPK